MSIKDITLGRYVYGTSVIHRLDPRTKLLSLLIISAVLFGGTGWSSLGLTSVFTMIVCLFSGLKPSYLMRSILPFKWLILITVILNVIFVGGHILIEAPLPYGGITREGLDFGLLYGGRIALLVLIASLLSLTTEPIVLVDGVEKMISPLSVTGIKPHEVAMAMVITIRFIPLLLSKASKIRKTYTARGLRPDGSVKMKLKFISFLFLPLFYSALRSAENLAVAMDCRLYRSSMSRTHYKETIMTRKDWTALTISFMFAFGITVL